MKYIIKRIFITKGSDRKSLHSDMEVTDLKKFKKELKEIYQADRIDLTYETWEQRKTLKLWNGKSYPF